MTLVLAWEMIEGIAVVADTCFGSNPKMKVEAGPKIFAVPIVLNRPGGGLDTEKCRLPSMGFAFAGDTTPGQFTNALASTCLQNLLVEGTFDEGPTVAAVADLYARCAGLVIREYRKTYRHDDLGFEGLIFGRDSVGSRARAFYLRTRINEEGNGACEAKELDLSEGVVALGTGAKKVREVYEDVKAAEDQGPAFFSPLDALRRVMDDEGTPSVAGHQQLAVATRSGVELRPGLRDLALRSLNPFVAREAARQANGIEDYQIMGFDMATIGDVGPYSPTATHFIAS